MRSTVIIVDTAGRLIALSTVDESVDVHQQKGSGPLLAGTQVLDSSSQSTAGIVERLRHRRRVEPQKVIVDKLPELRLVRPATVIESHRQLVTLLEPDLGAGHFIRRGVDLQC